MARKARGKKSDEYEWVAHIQIYFSSLEVSEAQVWLEGKVEDLARSIDSITSRDTSVKITLDQHRSSYQITLQPKAKSSPYRGYTLGFSHVDLGRGIAIMEYVHEVLMASAGISIPDKSGENDW